MLRNDADHNSLKWISPHCTSIMFVYTLDVMGCSSELDHLFSDIGYVSSMLKTVYFLLNAVNNSVLQSDTNIDSIPQVQFAIFNTEYLGLAENTQIYCLKSFKSLKCLNEEFIYFSSHQMDASYKLVKLSVQ